MLNKGSQIITQRVQGSSLCVITNKINNLIM